MSELNSPLRSVVAAWIEKIRKAMAVKASRFGKDAAEGMKFYDGPYDFMYKQGARNSDKHFSESSDDADDGEIPAPRFKMTCNKVAELVQIFGPVLYHKNPIRTVNPREIPLPGAELMTSFGADPYAVMFLQQAMQKAASQRAIDMSRASLMSAYMNYTPNALDLKTESRWAIDEALIKGRGCLWTEVYRTPTGQKMVGSFWDTVDNLQIDPDARTLRECKWIARRVTEPVWQAERRFGLPAGSLRASTESLNQQAVTDTHPDGDYFRKTGQTNDLIVYWEVWSKTGIGNRLTGFGPNGEQALGQVLERFGDYTYLAVCDGHTFPLNVPDSVWEMQEAQAYQDVARRVAWATPFWADDAWPVTVIDFHEIPGDPWPMSHIAPGLGELKFLNWAYSLLAGKIRVAARDFIAVMAEAGEDIRSKVLHGADYEWLELKGSQGKSINDLVQFLQHPPFQRDLWQVIQEISSQFDRRTGLNELMYGESEKQLRSAAEAEMKSASVNVRPDDMGNRVEDAMSALARNEAIAVRWHLTGNDVKPALGEFGAMMWDRFITPSEPSQLLYALEYRIEAGSVRKPNREREAANIKDAMQQLFPFYSGLALNDGLVEPLNNLLQQWGKAIDFNVDALMLQAPPPMPAPAGPPAEGGGGPPPQ